MAFNSGFKSVFALSILFLLFISVFAPALLFAVVSLLSMLFLFACSLVVVVVGCLLLCSCLFGVFLFVVGLLVRVVVGALCCVLCWLLIVWGKSFIFYYAVNQLVIYSLKRYIYFCLECCLL